MKKKPSVIWRSFSDQLSGAFIGCGGVLLYIYRSNGSFDDIAVNIVVAMMLAISCSFLFVWIANQFEKQGK